MPCESFLEWLSVPCSLLWNAASHRPLHPRNSLHSDCPLLYVAWQAASSIARRWPYIQRCGLICDSQSWARRNSTQVFLDVLFSDIPDRNLVSLAVCDRHTKNPLTQENSLGVVAEGTVAKVGEECFRLIKPLVNGEIVLGLAPKLLGAALRVLEWMRHS